MEPEITTSCLCQTNHTVHVEPTLTLELTLGFTNPAVQLFSSNYCGRHFYSLQALGGHQNAHKIERTRERRAMQMRMLSERYASLECLPLHGASLPLHGSAFQGFGIDSHASLHQRVQTMTGGARFDQCYLGIPIYMGEDEAQLSWCGSFRHIEGVGGSSTTHDPEHDEMTPLHSRDSSATLDLTLKL